MPLEFLEKKKIRLDLYLFYIRIFKSRTLATKYILSNRLILSGQITKKPDKLISIGDVLTMQINDEEKVLKVLEIPQRRGPYTETLFFYQDQTPVKSKQILKKNINKRNFIERVGRPTKLERRQIDKLMGRNKF